MGEKEKFAPQFETIEVPEAKLRKKHMTYGSERFESTVSNNHNEIFLTDTRKVAKIVLGKDVVLVLPKNPDDIPKWAGYPTHQESWLPLWFVLLNHAQHRTPEELSYRQRMNEKLTPEDRELMRKALIYKANEFWLAYKKDAETKEPRKKYKNITRILQDIFLYIDVPETVIENQEEYLKNHHLFPLIQKANELRRGIGIEQANDLENQIEQLLTDYNKQIGVEEIKRSYEELQKKLLQNSSDQFVVLVSDKTIVDAELYADLVSYDLSISESEHDQDVISIVSQLKEPRFYQLETKIGPKLIHKRRMDVIAIPEDIGVWDVVQGGKESYQPISMILLTHARPETESGKKIQERLKEELTPQFIAHYYLGAAEEFLHGDAWGKSFIKRFKNEKIKQIKKIIPLYRVACDLLPRAVYMLKTDKFPTNVDDEELWEIGETKEEARKIHEHFKQEAVTQDELSELSKAIEKKFQKWFKETDYLLFLENMEKIGQLETLTYGKQMQEVVRLSKQITELVPEDQREKIRKTIALAVIRHRGQSYEGEAIHLNHFLKVGKRAAEYAKLHGLGAELIQVAILHDILKETSITEKEIHRKLGKEIYKTVKTLTRKEGESDEEYLNRIGASGDLAVLVKRFEYLENLNDLISVPKEFCLQKLQELKKVIPIWQKIDPAGTFEIEKVMREILLKEK